MKYRDLTGTVDYNIDTNSFYGQIEDIDEHISYEASNEQDIYDSFTDAVDYYIENKEENEL